MYSHDNLSAPVIIKHCDLNYEGILSIIDSIWAAITSRQFIKTRELLVLPGLRSTIENGCIICLPIMLTPLDLSVNNNW
jgi:hypothetical protein